MEPVLTKLTQLPKEVCEDVVLTKFTWLTQENNFSVSVYQVGSANKGFSCFGILSLLDLFFGSSQLRKWRIIVISYIQVELTMLII